MKNPNPALAERTLAKISNCLLEDDADSALEILNLAFLECQADERMDEVEPWDLTVFPKRFYGVVNGERRVFIGETPEVDTLVHTDGFTYYVGSHK